jgi:hypothetical protein
MFRYCLFLAKKRLLKKYRSCFDGLKTVKVAMSKLNGNVETIEQFIHRLYVAMQLKLNPRHSIANRAHFCVFAII